MGDMGPQGRPVVIAASTAAVRDAAARLVAGAGFAVVSVGAWSPAELAASSVAARPLAYVLETGTDAALLTQTVYELYGRYAIGELGRPAIIGLCAESVAVANPSLTMWLIGGSSALECLQLVGDDLSGLGYLAGLLQRVARANGE